MSEKLLDFRSDTVTRPTPAMRAVMAQAAVGDDVFHEDPTTNELQEVLAEMLGKEAALFVPSGTMSNQIAIRVHCRPGDELLCESTSHIFNYEQGGYAQLSGVAARPVPGHYGIWQPEQLHGLIRPEDEHLVRTRLVCLENTHNRGGGRVWPYETLEAVCRWAHQHGLCTHLDGARLFNAVVATGIEARRWAQHFDTVSVCFSKSLGAPVGSALAGPRDLIREARRHRKLFGGGMRQSGILAAAALFALQHHIERLAEDHQNAQRLAQGIAQIPGLTLDPPDVQTNIVIFRVDPELGTAEQVVEALAQEGVLMIPFGRRHIRAVTHLDVNAEDVQRAIDALATVVQHLGKQKPSAASAPGGPYAG